MLIDFELLLRNGRDLIAQGKITCEDSDAAIRNSRKILAASLHGASERKLSNKPDSE